MRSRAGGPRTGLVLHFPQLLLLLTVALGVFTVSFGIWTATSIWSFPRFAIAVVFCLYVPGKLVLDVAGVEPRPLEDLTLSLVLGMTVSSILYWILAYLALEHVLVLFLFAAVLAYSYRRRNRWRGIWSYRVSIDPSHIVLLVVIILCLVPLGILPIYYRNVDLLPGSSMTYARRPFDVVQHLSFAYELTHSVPPEVPFFSGETLDYHYGMDLLAAMLSRIASLSVLDLTARFLPTFFLVTAVLAIFCFSRFWLDSRYGAVLVTFLVVFGEDLSFVPGLLLGSNEVWSEQFFGVPTTYSLYSMNPMLPALGILFAGFLCLAQYWKHGGRVWPILTAFLFAALMEYKVFATAHVMVSLAVAGVIGLLLFRHTRLLKVLAMTLLLGAPLFLHTLVGSQAGAKMWMRIDPWPYVPEALKQMGLLSTSVGSEIAAIYQGGTLSAGGAAGLFLVALPGYLLGSLGMRVIGIPVVLRDLVSIRRSRGLSFFAALFGVLGPLVTLTCAATPWGYPQELEYNNTVWFYVQSKYVMWIFVVELILILCRGRRRSWQALVVAATVGLSIPSTVQYFQNQMHGGLEALDENELELMRFLGQSCPDGEVVLSRRKLAELIVGLAPCRVPVLSPGSYTHLFVSRPALERREEDMGSFWDAWREGEFRSDILERYAVDYVVVDRRVGDLVVDEDFASAGNGEEGREALTLVPSFENEHFVVYSVVREDGTTS